VASEKRFFSRYGTAVIRVWLGDHDGAFSGLDRALADRDWGLSLTRVDARLEPLRGDPRFEDLARRIRFV
jgi:hypothetical protein